MPFATHAHAHAHALASPFLNLPLELLYLVADLLSPRDLATLLATSHHVTALLLPCALHSRDSHGTTPFHWLTETRVFLPTLNRILTTHQVPLISTTNNTGYTPLHWATLSGNLSAVNLLLAVYPDCAITINRSALTTTNITNISPLHCAAVNGAPAIIRTLISAGAPPNAVAKGWTPLHLATSTSDGHGPAVLALIAGGADPDIIGRSGWSAIHCAAARGHANVLRALTKSGSANVNLREGTMINGASRGDGSADDNDPSQNGDGDAWTALHIASFRGMVEIVNILLEAGADVDAEAASGWLTPLHCAVWKKHEEVVRCLLTGTLGASCETLRMVERLAMDIGHDRILSLIRGGLAKTRICGKKDVSNTAGTEA